MDGRNDSSGTIEALDQSITKENLGDILVYHYATSLRGIDEQSAADDQDLQEYVNDFTAGRLAKINLIEDEASRSQELAQLKLQANAVEMALQGLVSTRSPRVFMNSVNTYSTQPVEWPLSKVRVEVLPGSNAQIRQLVGHNNDLVHGRKELSSVEGIVIPMLDTEGGILWVRSRKFLTDKMFEIRPVIDKKDNYSAGIKLTYL